MVRCLYNLTEKNNDFKILISDKIYFMNCPFGLASLNDYSSIYMLYVSSMYINIHEATIITLHV